MWDFISDCNFSYSVFENDNNGDSIGVAIASLIFVILPWFCNLVFLVFFIKKWIGNMGDVNAGGDNIISAWVFQYRILLVMLCMVSGGAHATILLCNSRLFGLPQLRYSLGFCFVSLFFLNRFRNFKCLFFLLFLVYFGTMDCFMQPFKASNISKRENNFEN